VTQPNDLTQYVTQYVTLPGTGMLLAYDRF